MPTNRNLSNLIINKVDSQEVFEQMQTNNLLNDDELYLIQDEGAGDDTLYLESVPGETTEGRKGQRAFVIKYGNATTDYAYYYICYGYVTNGGTRKYIWSQVNSKTITHPDKPAAGEPIIFTKSGTFYAADYGLSVGDTVTVAVVSGGNGGCGCGFTESVGGDAGKGGPAGPNDYGSNLGGGGGGAGKGYGAGGGGAGGYYKSGFGPSGSMSTGGDGGRAGGCTVKTITLTSTTIPVTVGIGGKGYNGGGGDTTHIGGSSSFGSYVTVTGGTGSYGGEGGSSVYHPNAWDGSAYEDPIFGMACGGGGGGGGGWYFVSGNTKLSQYGSGSNGTDGFAQLTGAGYDGYGGNGGSGGGGISGGAGGYVSCDGWGNPNLAYSGESTEPTAGSDGDLGGNGVVYIWI